MCVLPAGDTGENAQRKLSRSRVFYLRVTQEKRRRGKLSRSRVSYLRVRQEKTGVTRSRDAYLRVR